jgi:DNA-binding response OmpR family regulator
MRILAIEDEPAILRLLDRGLGAAGHEVTAAFTGEEGVILAEDATIDLVLLDIGLPEIDGHDVLSRIRTRRPGLPVLMLTARDDMSNKLKALNAGADDYITKPFAFDELIARINAMTRHQDGDGVSTLTVGDVRLDIVARRAWRGDRRIDLTTREFALLEYLLRHPDVVLARSQILDDVWGPDIDPGSNVVDVYVRYLRGKLGEPTPITTLRGAGYRFDSSPPASSGG